MNRLLLWLAVAAMACAAFAADKPNFVLIFADDLGINDLSCYGRKDQPTPQPRPHGGRGHALHLRLLLAADLLAVAGRAS